ncbi:MAG: ParB/RepB/Spo0J family partition protein [Betaproteobacteria bacterium]|nr:ParB/RepB/Spo0J family partition protein [Betaproteobacteria bacterium]MCH9848603.1 ParB/RepB/Spo0J family partition protein [Betaproteobacteria bacterium]
MAKHKGLGRGLDALLAGDDEAANSEDGLRMLSVAQMQSGKYQPRSHMDETALQTLADSIKSQGIMQPILVREIAPEQYEIIAGERRWRASQMAGLTEVPVLIREIEDESALEMALIENIQRENLNPVEEALGIKRLIDEFAMTHEKAANAVGRSRVAVSNLLRLLTLAGGVQTMLMENKLDMGHARALVGLDAAQQVMLANKIVQQDLSVREVESLVKKVGVDTKPKAQKTDANRDVLALQNRLSEKLGTGVSIAAKANGTGTLKINYSNLDELDEIIKKVTG